MGTPVTLVDPNGDYVPATGGSVAVSNFPETQAVSGPLTNTQLRAADVSVTGPLTNAQISLITGTSGSTAWGGAGGASIIAILKAMYAQNVTIIGLLTDIKINTTP